MTESVISYKTETGVTTLPDTGITPQRALALREMSRALNKYDAEGYLADGAAFIGLTFSETPNKIPFGWTREKDAPAIKPDTDNDEGVKAKNYFESLLKNINTTGDVFGPNAGGIVERSAAEEKSLPSDIFTPKNP